jgi:hypothetical protein
MKYIKDINESIQLNGSGPTNITVAVRRRSPQNPLGLNNYYMMSGQLEPIRDDYYQTVRDACFNIGMDFLSISEKNFTMLDRLKEVIDKVVNERQDEFDLIVFNCKNRNFRTQYCAETVFHTIVQGRLNALAERPFAMGGLQPQQ